MKATKENKAKLMELMKERIFENIDLDKISTPFDLIEAVKLNLYAFERITFKYAADYFVDKTTTKKKKESELN